jgi:hypothetical protein
MLRSGRNIRVFTVPDSSSDEDVEEEIKVTEQKRPVTPLEDEPEDEKIPAGNAASCCHSPLISLTASPLLFMKRNPTCISSMYMFCREWAARDRPR